MIHRLTFLGELSKTTGYGQHTAVLVKALQEAGYYVSIRPFHVHPGIPPELAKLFVHCPQPEDWEIILSPPHRQVTPGKRTIYYTMWESTRLPERSVEILNKSELVLVPTEWNRAGFAASGVTVPMEVVPLGVNRDVYPYRPQDGLGTVFSAAGNLHNGAKRKGVSEAIRAFQMAFHYNPRVRMQVKVSGPLETTDSRIEIISKPMADAEMARWHGTAHCFVSMAKAEGWGLMQLQAMSTGRPLIAPMYAGLASFFDQTVGYPVFHREVPAQETWEGHGNWAEPNLEHAALLMRHVHANREEARALGEKASVRAEQFTWDKSTRLFLEIVGRTMHG